MSLKFWKKSFYSFVATGILASIVAFPGEAPSSPYPRFFSTVEQLIKIDDRSYHQLWQKSALSSIGSRRLTELKDIALDPVFLQSILFHSPAVFSDLAAEDECRFYAFLEQGLLSRPLHIMQNIPIRYTDQGKRLLAVVPAKDFFAFIYGKKHTQCQINNDQKRLFRGKSLKKTLAMLKLPVPSNWDDCFKIFQEWREKPLLAPLCRLAEGIRLVDQRKRQLAVLATSDGSLRRQLKAQIAQAQYLTQLLSPFQVDYLVHTCSSLGSTGKFCAKFVDTSFWTRVASNRLGRMELAAKCHMLLGKDQKSLTAKELVTCAEQFSRDKKLCHYLESERYPALAPSPDCGQISRALGVSRLRANYQDCPGKVDNEGMINFSRMLAHLEDKQYGVSPSSCNHFPVAQFVEFNFDHQNEEVWDLSICYPDPIENKQLCRPAIVGQGGDSRYAEGNVVVWILHRMKLAPKSTKCQFVEREKYNPSRLKYQNKCFLIYDEEQCTSLACPKQIMYRNRNVSNITYQGFVAFDYFPNSLRSDQRSITYTLNRVRKIGRRPIRNITELKYYLKSSANALAHGRGCIEDIYPRNFSKRYMNQCTPVSFIIDGLLEEDFRFYVTIRTGADSVHAPRIVSWYNVYQSLVSYQAMQPIEHWTLYGIR